MKNELLYVAIAMRLHSCQATYWLSVVWHICSALCKGILSTHDTSLKPHRRSGLPTSYPLSHVEPQLPGSFSAKRLTGMRHRPLRTCLTSRYNSR